jgi:hypothetical protein
MTCDDNGFQYKPWMLHVTWRELNSLSTDLEYIYRIIEDTDHAQDTYHAVLFKFCRTHFTGYIVISMYSSKIL